MFLRDMHGGVDVPNFLQTTEDCTDVSCFGVQEFFFAIAGCEVSRSMCEHFSSFSKFILD